MIRKNKPKSRYHSVMLVDDNEIDNFINQKMIESVNFTEKLFKYTSGKSALEFLQNMEQDDSLIRDIIPDYIFLDINMPMMDGFQFLEEFDQLNDKIKAKCKIAILTTSINPMDQEKSLSNPLVTTFINKPLTKESLANL